MGIRLIYLSAKLLPFLKTYLCILAVENHFKPKQVTLRRKATVPQAQALHLASPHARVPPCFYLGMIQPPANNRMTYNTSCYCSLCIIVCGL